MTCCVNDRIDVANTVLHTFAPDTKLRIDAQGYVVVEWTTRHDVLLSRRWMTRGQDWYPVWHRHWGHGGTACVALSQLVRWCRDKPVLPLTTWRYWAGEQVRLLRYGDVSSALSALRNAGYPEVATCVLCGRYVDGGCDWWSLKGLSGPCCAMRSGCKQMLKGGAT